MVRLIIGSWLLAVQSLGFDSVAKFAFNDLNLVRGYRCCNQVIATKFGLEEHKLVVEHKLAEVLEIP